MVDGLIHSVKYYVRCLGGEVDVLSAAIEFPATSLTAVVILTVYFLENANDADGSKVGDLAI